MEITCVGIGVISLGWQRDGDTIGGVFTASVSMEGDTVQEAALRTILDSVRIWNTVANMTSRLVGNVSNLITVDRITCVGVGSMSTEDTVTLNYSLRGNYSYIHYPSEMYDYNVLPMFLFLFAEPPPLVPSTNFSVSIESDGTTVDVSITWDSAFN